MKANDATIDDCVAVAVKNLNRGRSLLAVQLSPAQITIVGVKSMGGKRSSRTKRRKTGSKFNRGYLMWRRLDGELRIGTPSLEKVSRSMDLMAWNPGHRGRFKNKLSQ